MSLWDVYYFKLKKNQDPKDSKKLQPFFNNLKNLDRGPVSRMDLSPEVSAKNMSQMQWGESTQCLEIRVQCASYCFCMTQQTFIYRTFDFPSPCQLPSPQPHKFQPIIPNILFCFQLKTVFKDAFGHFGESLSFSRSLPCICVFNFDLFLLICLKSL